MHPPPLHGLGVCCQQRGLAEPAAQSGMQRNLPRMTGSSCELFRGSGKSQLSSRSTTSGQAPKSVNLRKKPPDAALQVTTLRESFLSLFGGGGEREGKACKSTPGAPPPPCPRFVHAGFSLGGTNSHRLAKPHTHLRWRLSAIYRALCLSLCVRQ
jgi:hypothetical protein